MRKNIKIKFDKIMDAINEKMLGAYSSALKETQRVRKVFKGGRVGKILKYPLAALLAKIGSLIIPSYEGKLVVKNRLFFGDIFYTRGYYLDYYTCGFIAEENEIVLTKFFIRNIKIGDTFFDVGANFGFFSALARRLVCGDGADINAKNLVHAFEPTPDTYEILSKNMGETAIINQVAVGNSSGKTDFFVFEDSRAAGSNSLHGDLAKEQIGGINQKKITAQVITLDEYCTIHKTIPSFIKIDVEGAEFEVISGGKEIVTKNKPIIAMEIWPKGHNINHLKAVGALVEIGYDVFTLDSDGQPSLSSLEKVGLFDETQNVVFIYKR